MPPSGAPKRSASKSKAKAKAQATPEKTEKRNSLVVPEYGKPAHTMQEAYKLLEKEEELRKQAKELRERAEKMSNQFAEAVRMLGELHNQDLPEKERELAKGKVKEEIEKGRAAAKPKPAATPSPKAESSSRGRAAPAGARKGKTEAPAPEAAAAAEEDADEQVAHPRPEVAVNEVEHCLMLARKKEHEADEVRQKREELLNEIKEAAAQIEKLRSEGDWTFHRDFSLMLNPKAQLKPLNDGKSFFSPPESPRSISHPANLRSSRGGDNELPPEAVHRGSTQEDVSVSPLLPNGGRPGDFGHGGLPAPGSRRVSFDDAQSFLPSNGRNSSENHASGNESSAAEASRTGRDIGRSVLPSSSRRTSIHSSDSGSPLPGRDTGPSVLPSNARRTSIRSSDSESPPPGRDHSRSMVQSSGRRTSIHSESPPPDARRVSIDDGRSTALSGVRRTSTGGPGDSEPPVAGRRGSSRADGRPPPSGERKLSSDGGHSVLSNIHRGSGGGAPPSDTRRASGDAGSSLPSGTRTTSGDDRRSPPSNAHGSSSEGGDSLPSKARRASGDGSGSVRSDPRRHSGDATRSNPSDAPRGSYDGGGSVASDARRTSSNGGGPHPSTVRSASGNGSGSLPSDARRISRDDGRSVQGRTGSGVSGGGEARHARTCIVSSDDEHSVPPSSGRRMSEGVLGDSELQSMDVRTGGRLMRASEEQAMKSGRLSGDGAPLRPAADDRSFTARPSSGDSLGDGARSASDSHPIEARRESFDGRRSSAPTFDRRSTIEGSSEGHSVCGEIGERGGRTSDARLDSTDVDDEGNAATRLQACWRGCRARYEYKRQQSRLDAKSDDVRRGVSVSVRVQNLVCPFSNTELQKVAAKLSSELNDSILPAGSLAEVLLESRGDRSIGDTVVAIVGIVLRVIATDSTDARQLLTLWDCSDGQARLCEVVAAAIRNVDGIDASKRRQIRVTMGNPARLEDFNAYQLTLKRAVDLLDLGWTGNELFCVCAVRPKSSRHVLPQVWTRTRTNTSAPKWSETHAVTCAEGDILEFVVCDRGPNAKTSSGFASLRAVSFHRDGFTGMLPINDSAHAKLEVAVVPAASFTDGACGQVLSATEVFRSRCGRQQVTDIAPSGAVRTVHVESAASTGNYSLESAALKNVSGQSVSSRTIATMGSASYQATAAASSATHQATTTMQQTSRHAVSTYRSAAFPANAAVESAPCEAAARMESAYASFAGKESAALHAAVTYQSASCRAPVSSEPVPIQVSGTTYAQVCMATSSAKDITTSHASSTAAQAMTTMESSVPGKRKSLPEPPLAPEEGEAVFDSPARVSANEQDSALQYGARAMADGNCSGVGLHADGESWWPHGINNGGAMLLDRPNLEDTLTSTTSISHAMSEEEIRLERAAAIAAEKAALARQKLEALRSRSPKPCGHQAPPKTPTSQVACAALDPPRAPLESDLADPPQAPQEGVDSVSGTYRFADIEDPFPAPPEGQADMAPSGLFSELLACADHVDSQFQHSSGPNAAIALQSGSSFMPPCTSHDDNGHEHSSFQLQTAVPTQSSANCHIMRTCAGTASEPIPSLTPFATQNDPSTHKPRPYADEHAHAPSHRQACVTHSSCNVRQAVAHVDHKAESSVTRRTSGAAPGPWSTHGSGTRSDDHAQLSTGRQATAGGQRFYGHQQARTPSDDHGQPVFDWHTSVAAQSCGMQQSSIHVDDHAQMCADRQETSTTRNICTAQRAVPSSADDDAPASGWQAAAASLSCSTAQHGQPLLAEEALFAETTAAMAKFASPSLQHLHTSTEYDAAARCQHYSQMQASEALQNFASVPLQSLQPHDPVQLPPEEHTKAPTQRCDSVQEARRRPDDNVQSSQASSEARAGVAESCSARGTSAHVAEQTHCAPERQVAAATQRSLHVQQSSSGARDNAHPAPVYQLQESTHCSLNVHQAPTRVDANAQVASQGRAAEIRQTVHQSSSRTDERKQAFSERQLATATHRDINLRPAPAKHDDRMQPCSEGHLGAATHITSKSSTRNPQPLSERCSATATRGCSGMQQAQCDPKHKIRLCFDDLRINASDFMLQFAPDLLRYFRARGVTQQMLSLLSLSFHDGRVADISGELSAMEDLWGRICNRRITIQGHAAVAQIIADDSSPSAARTQATRPFVEPVASSMTSPSAWIPQPAVAGSSQRAVGSPNPVLSKSVELAGLNSPAGSTATPCDSGSSHPSHASPWSPRVSTPPTPPHRGQSPDAAQQRVRVEASAGSNQWMLRSVAPSARNPQQHASALSTSIVAEGRCSAPSSSPLHNAAWGLNRARPGNLQEPWRGGTNPKAVNSDCR